MSRFGVGTVLFVACSACEPHLVDVQFIEESRPISRVERNAIQDIADSTARDVRKWLPALPTALTLVVRPGKDVIPETGETATAVHPASVYWTFDPDRDVLSIIRNELRPTLFHELHHLVRETNVRRETLMDSVVTEGTATAFEPATASRETWLHRHPDGRRWIGMKVGTFLVDRAMKTSGRTSAEMVAVPTEEILMLAGVRAWPRQDR